MAVTLPDFDIKALQGVADAYFYGSQLVGGQGTVMGKLGLFPFFMHHYDFQQTVLLALPVIYYFVSFLLSFT